MKRNAKLKKILISIVALILVAAIGIGIWYSAGTNTEPVNVFAFNHIGMTEYWGDSQESYGFVQTDKLQTVFLSTTQSVTEVMVSVGDEVHKGDVLMSFDTTLSDLALERKRLDVEKLKLQLEDANTQLKRIKAMKPMVIPTTTTDEEETNQGVALTDPYKLSTQTAYDGSTADKALICWLNSSTAVSDEIFQALLQQAEAFQNQNALLAAGSSSASAAVPAEDAVIPTEAPTAAPTEAPTAPPTEAPTAAPTEAPSAAPDNTPEPTSAPAASPDPDPEPTEPEYIHVNRFYAVFKVTSGNMSLGSRTVWQGVLVTKTSSGFSFRFFDASSLPDHMLAANETVQTTPQIDYGSGYTSSQLAQMRSDQEKTIKDLEFNIKMAEADYKIMLTEVSDGKVYADVDGTVVSLLTEEEAQMTGQPLIKVSGGGGFFVEGSISELDRDEMTVGSEVSINDWSSGMVYTGTIQSIGDYPSSRNYWTGLGNPTATYYPFTVFVEESADLQSGSYVSITYSAGSSENGIYLQNPFLRTENGRSYVYVRGADGTLEQRFVTTGKSLWGSYTEILDGITSEDFLAFPYGTDVKPGAQTVEAELRALYE